MALIDGKWHVVRGDCMWNIAASVYGNGRRWPEIANANGVPTSNPVIYPGQVFIIPGVTPSTTPPPTPAPSAPVVNRSVKVEWWALDAGTSRDMFVTWSYDRANTDHYEVRWAYDTGAGGWREQGTSTTTEKQSSYGAPESAKRVRVQIKPIAATHRVGNNDEPYWTDGEWVTKEYNYADNPPELPPSPQFSINNQNKLVVDLNNIQETINAEQIEIAIYQDNILKYKTATVNIDLEARYAHFETVVDAGHNYKVRCRGVRGNIYGGWTDYTEIDWATPIAPEEITLLRTQVISEQQTKLYSVVIEWTEEASAEQYTVQWVTSIENWDTSQMSSQDTEEGSGPRLIINGLDLGHEYFFRVKSKNSKGMSATATPVKSVTLGTRPETPTTWSNVVSCILGEDLNLYWVHNSTDGSYESYARLHIEVTDSAHPELQPLVIVKVIENNRPEEQRGQTSVYTINTNDPEWATIGEGYSIKWKVQTCGVTSEYSEWSIEREANIYAQPTVTVGLISNEQQSVDEIDTFPFYVSVVSGPNAQIPISYYIEIVSNDAYETIDEIGKIKMVNIGDKVYQKYYDPQNNPWRFLLEMTPGNIDLEGGVTYTINVTVAMNSGLSATGTTNFIANFHDIHYDVYGFVVFNKETLEASIHPYCNKYVENGGEIVPVLVEDCTLSVYRREYDGSFMEIATDIPNQDNYYVTDPHPSLDYARYRVVAKMNDTGAISYGDIQPEKTGIPGIIIQWAEEWSSFISEEDGTGTVEPPWSGSMLKLPYNVSISENKSPDVSLVKYAGRKRPVSYYGTHLGESATWSTSIPKEDKETLYAIRRLSEWMGDCYVRESSGSGYWANIKVSYNVAYSDVTIPITLNVTRVEGGM